jgi:hypothetical protein
VSVTQRLRRLDDRVGATFGSFRRAERLELRRQARTGNPREIDPELERRGRAWAEPLVRPLRQQRALVAAYLVSLTFAAVATALGIMGYPSWIGAFFGVVVPVSQEVKRWALRREAERLLSELPPS